MFKIKRTMKITKTKRFDKAWYDEGYKLHHDNKLGYTHNPEISIYANIWQQAIKYLKVLDNPLILDLGCGSGQFINLAVKNKIDIYLGIDFSKEAINIAKQMNPQIATKFVCDDLSVLTKDYFKGLPKNIVIVSFETLEHISFDIELVSYLISGQKFIFSVPNFDYKSHYRTYNNIDEIENRFGKYINIQNFTPFTADRNKPHKYIEYKENSNEFRKIIYLVESIIK